MARHLFFLLILFITGVTTPDILAQHKKIENSLFWEISGNGLDKPSHLFGTYHILNHSYLEELPRVKTAFEKADGVVVEMVVDSAKLQQLVVGMMLSGKKLSELLNEEEYKLVADEVKKTLGTDLAHMDQFSPVFVTLMLTMTYYQNHNKDFFEKYKGMPVDYYFAADAKKRGKSVVGIETMEEQLNILLKHDTPEEQARQLVAFVKSSDEMAKSVKELTSLYVNQDLSGMYTLYRKYEKQFGDASYLLDDRNVKWMEKLPSILSEGNRFVAVGALHLTGEKGLVKLLREAGYTVKPLKTGE